MAALLRRLGTNFDLYRILFAEHPVLGDELGGRLQEWQRLVLVNVQDTIRQTSGLTAFKP